MRYTLPFSTTLALIFASAFGHGGEMLWGQGLVALAGAIGLIHVAAVKHQPWSRLLSVAALAWATLVAWCIAQALPMGLAVHPSWIAARSILEGLGPGAIAIDPQATLDAAIRLAAYGGVFALGLHAAQRPGDWLIWLAVGIGVTVIVGLMVDANSVGPAGLAKVRHWGDAAFPFANRNHFCVFAGIGVLAAIGSLLDPIGRIGWRRYVACAALLVCLGAAFASHSRAGLLVLACGVGVTVFLNRPPHRWLVIVFIAASALALLFAAGVVVRFETIGAAARLRLDIMAAASELAWQAPWTGVGSFDLAIQGIAPPFGQGMVQSAHNIVLESLVERGAPATILAIAAITLVVGQCARSIQASRAGKVCGATALGVATMVLLHGMVDFSVHSPSIAALVAIVLGLGAGLAVVPASSSAVGLARGNPLEGARA